MDKAVDRSCTCLVLFQSCMTVATVARSKGEISYCDTYNITLSDQFASAIQGFLGSNTNFRIVFVGVVCLFSSSVKSAIGILTGIFLNV